MNLKERAKKLKIDLPAVFLAMKDKRTPFLAKAIAALCVAYALSPIDLIPDFIPVLGYLDDVILLPLLIALSIKLIPAEVLSDCREKAKKIRLDKSKNRLFAIPVILIWLLIIFLIIKAIFL